MPFQRSTPKTVDSTKLAESIFKDVCRKFEQAVLSHLGLKTRQVQIDGAAQLLGRRIVEMQTGEGKTLTTALAAAAFVASGRKVLVATANDYLAIRDVEWMRPLFSDLGVTAAAVTSSTSLGLEERYGANITYGTIRQFGFDFLRIGIAKRNETDVDRSRLDFPFDVLIVDEADSVLIDEARTPMIITSVGDSLTPSFEAMLRWAAEQAETMAIGRDYVSDDSTGSIALLAAARKRLLQTSMPTNMTGLSTTEILHAVERALMVKQRFQHDHHYIVQSGQVRLVDEYTGRVSAGRKLAGGIHQALEAKEGLELTPLSTSIAKITVQDFVAKFWHASGLTATAYEDRHEFRAVYGLTLSRLPTHRPVQRLLMPSVICCDRNEKWQRIADEVTELTAQCRAVLIGTRTIQHSQALSAVLADRGIRHEVLNAFNTEQESKLVSLAGQAGQVTVATNMAGRGTDIPLSDEVRSNGGLHVIVSELHASRRIDRQLMGRSARQGDPGSARMYLSADDELIQMAMGTSCANEVKSDYGSRRNDRSLMRTLFRAQRTLTKRHREQRLQLTRRESQLGDAMRTLGLDPQFDPIPDDCV